MSSIFTLLPTPFEMQKNYPLSPHYKQIVCKKRRIGEKIMQGHDRRLIIFVGPCSIHHKELTLEYASLFQKLAKKVEDRLFLIMRVFLEKPRTQFGWKGYLYDPDLDGTCAIEKGLILTRELLLELMEMDIPIATEFLDPLLFQYHQDFFTWGMIGARSCASQIHRQMASHLNFPVGFKNEIDGTFDHGICGALAARHPQTLTGINKEGKIGAIQSKGNPHTHLILRGFSKSPNYDKPSVAKAIERQHFHGLKAPLVIDCSHGNSQKNHQKQINVFNSVLEQIIEGNRLIIGAMLESHLQEGRALSITDPCLDWEATESLIWKAYTSLSSGHCINLR